MPMPDTVLLISSTIPVEYTCAQCGATHIRVEVPSRLTDAENVTDWMETVVAAISRDHDLRSPGCVIEKFTEVRIPVTGASRIGGVAGT